MPKDGLTIKQRSTLCALMLLKRGATPITFSAIDACFDDVFRTSREDLAHALVELEKLDLVKLVRSGKMVIAVSLTRAGRDQALTIKPYQMVGRLNLKTIRQDFD